MIVYQLSCGEGHFFEGWFASSQACDEQTRAGQLQCPACSSVEVRKLPAAPHVHTSGASSGVEDAALRRQVAGALRKFIVANTENVGRKFAEVARRIHYKEEKARGIRGQVTAEEAAELREEGVPTFSISPDVIASEEVH